MMTTKPKEFKILLGVTGSVAAVKVPFLVEELSKFATVRVVTTTAGFHFLQDVDLSPAQVYKDDTEWLEFKKVGDPVLHIELRKWADVMVIAPLGANTLAKMATGLCDNLLSMGLRCKASLCSTLYEYIDVVSPTDLPPAIGTPILLHEWKL